MGRSRSECIKAARTCELGQVLAFRPGSIGNEHDDDSDDDSDHDCVNASLPFWLAAVVRPWQPAEEDATVHTTFVQKGEHYMIVRWLELAAGRVYQLSDVDDVITDHRVESLIVFKDWKKLGTLATKKRKKSNIISYTLDPKLEKAMSALRKKAK